MILTCPACATRYRVADQEFEGSSGRTVRCGNCGYLWHETAHAQPSPESGKPPAASAGTAPILSAKPPSEAARSPGPRLEIPPNSQPQRRVRSSVTRTTALAILIISGAIAWVFVRGHFATDRPSNEKPPVAVDQPTPAARSQTGLVIRKITPSRTAEGLVVAGEIANPDTVARDVPRLRVALWDAADKEVQSEIVDPPKTRLQPGEVVHFEAPFAHPPDTASGVVVTFASS